LTATRTSIAFEAYWAECLYPADPAAAALAAPIYTLARNGIAHAFLSKPGIIVTKHAPARHLTWDNERFYLDVTALYQDFKASYDNGARARILVNGERGRQSLLDRYGTDEVKLAIQTLRSYGQPYTGDHRNQATTTIPDRPTTTMSNSPTLPPKY
jgi:hypothetical protein